MLRFGMPTLIETATIEECAYVLKREGAKMVCALTYATTIKEPKTYKNQK